MFLSNKYQTWYYQIINNAKAHPRNGYTENHHIIPSSLGGSDDANNKVKLTAREHFVRKKCDRATTILCVNSTTFSWRIHTVSCHGKTSCSILHIVVDNLQ